MSKKRDLHIKLDLETWSIIEDQCNEHGMNITEFITEAIRQYTGGSNDMLWSSINDIQDDVAKIKKKINKM